MSFNIYPGTDLISYTADPSKTYVVLMEPASMMGAGVLIPVSEIDGLWVAVPDGDPSIINVPSGLVEPSTDFAIAANQPVSGNSLLYSSESITETPITETPVSMPVYSGMELSAYGADMAQNYVIMIDPDNTGNGQLIPVTGSGEIWTPAPMGDPAIITISDGTLAMPPVETTTQGNYTPVAETPITETPVSETPTLMSGEIGFTNVQVTNVSADANTVSMDVVLPAGLSNLSGLHIDLLGIAATNVVGIGGAEVAVFRGDSSFVVVDPGDLSPNTWTDGPVLTLTFEGLSDAQAASTGNDIVSAIIDSSYIQTYDDSGWVTVSSIGYIEPSATTPVTETPVTETPITETPITETPITETPVSMPVYSGMELSAYGADMAQNYVIMIDPDNTGNGQLIPVTGSGEIWTPAPMGDPAIITISDGTLAMPPVETTTQGNYTPVAETPITETPVSETPTLMSGEIGFTNVQVTNVSADANTVSMDVVLPAGLSNLSGLHIDLLGIAATNVVGIGGAEVAVFRGDSSFVVVDPGDLSPNTWTDGPVLTLTFEGLSDAQAASTGNDIVSAIIDSSYIQTYDDSGWVTVSSIGYIEPSATTPVTETPVTETPITETPITETPVTETPGDVEATGYDGSYWPDPQLDPADIVDFVTNAVGAEGGTMYSPDAAFDNSVVNGIDTSLGGFANDSIDAGLGMDYVIGGVGGYTIDGGSGFDIYTAITATAENIADIDGNIVGQNGIAVDLDASRVTYYGLDTHDVVLNTEYFLGTLADDKFVGATRYDTEYSLQVFNPSGGSDEIFGAPDQIDPTTGEMIDIKTVVDYNGMQGGQGIVFVLEGNANIVNGSGVAYSTETSNDISEQAGSDWNYWLPSGPGVIDDQGFISNISKFDNNADNNNATVILDTFGDVDLAFDVDIYRGSDTSDLFYGSAEDDIFEAGNGHNNVMFGGDGYDELVVNDVQESNADDIDLNSISVTRAFNYSDIQQVDITSGELVAGSDTYTGYHYRVDFADLADNSTFITENLSQNLIDTHGVTSKYALFVVTNQDLGTSFPTSSDYAFDLQTGKIDIYGNDLSVLETLTSDVSGELVLSQETVIAGRYMIEGETKDKSEVYTTFIENVEKVTLIDDDIQYFGSGNLTNSSEDSYELLIGGQGDLGDMLYVTTGENLDSTTGVGSYSINSNFIKGEIYYSGNHVDFDRTSSVGTWANSVAAAYTTIDNIEQAKIWNDEVAQFFVWYDPDGAEGAAEGYEIGVRYQNGNINSWGIDNRQFDTFQNVTVDAAMVDDIKLQFGDSINVKEGDYRVLYEAAFSDIEAIIASDNDVNNWNFDIPPTSSRSTFYIQVGGDTTGENGNSGVLDTQVTNVKVDRVEVNGTFEWVVNPQAEILVNLPNVSGATEASDLMISGSAAETLEAGRGSDVMMGRGGSDNYKINIGDTITTVDGVEVTGDYGVAGDVINEIGGSSEDKSDSITLSSATSIDQLTFSRTEIQSEYWGNTLQIDVDYNSDDIVDDRLYVFDHFNQNLGFRAVEQLFLDDGWDTDEIWNLIVGDYDGSSDNYNGTAGQDILMAGIGTSNLYGGDGKDIMIGDESGNYQTVFELGNNDTNTWDGIEDVIENFGAGDQIDLSALGITEAAELTAVGNELKVTATSATIATIDFTDTKTVADLLLEDGSIIYA